MENFSEEREKIDESESEDSSCLTSLLVLWLIESIISGWWSFVKGYHTFEAINSAIAIICFVALVIIVLFKK